MENNSLITKNTQTRVSSTLYNNSTDYGKQLMFDGKDDTCWNSAEGQSQFIFFVFEKTVNIKKIEIVFQGGFCPRVLFYQLYEVEVLYSNEDELKVKKKVMDLTEYKKYSINDTNDMQVKYLKRGFRIGFGLQKFKIGHEVFL